MGFRVLEFRVGGLGFRVLVLGFRVGCLGFRDLDLQFRFWGLGFLKGYYTILYPNLAGPFIGAVTTHAELLQEDV